MVCISVSRDPSLKVVFASKVSSLLNKTLKYHNEAYKLQDKELQKRLSKIVLGKLLVLAPSFWWRLIGERNRVVFTEDLLPEIVKLPDPSLHKISFVRGSPLPLVTPVRTGEKTFRIGVLDDGREFRLSLEDLYRHCYVIDQTGSGKTSFIKMLIHRLRELRDASIIIIDPHGDMARELAEEIPESIYLHPFRSPFGLNPLDLPKHENRGLCCHNS